MTLRRVVNASPIIFLNQVGLLDQLNEAGVTVLIPAPVLEELGGLGPDDPAASTESQVPPDGLPWIEGSHLPSAACIALSRSRRSDPLELSLSDLAGETAH